MKKQKSLLANPLVSGFKFHKLKIIVLGVLVAFSCMSFVILKITGPDPGYSGSPNDGAECTGCHADNSVNTGIGSANITSTVPAGGYVGGNTYSITATVSYSVAPNNTRFGFELSPQTPAGAKLGTLHATPETQIITQGAEYIEHVLTSVAGTNTRSWTFTWTAPVAGTGPVTFYGAFLAANADDDVTGDYVYSKTLTVSEIAPLSSGTVTHTNVSCYNACNGSATANATGGTPPYTYYWSTSPIQVNQTATGLCAGTYTAVITDAVAATVTSIVAITQPAAALTATMSSTNETIGSDGTATATPAGGTLPYTYAWATVPVQTTQMASGLDGPFTYTVSVADAHNCAGTYTVFVDSHVGVVSLENVNSIRAYPNPSRGDFYIEINSSNSEEFTLNVMDVTGKIVYNEMLQLTKGKNIRPISFATESEGVFFIQLKSKNGVMKVLPIAKLN